MLTIRHITIVALVVLAAAIYMAGRVRDPGPTHGSQSVLDETASVYARDFTRKDGADLPAPPGDEHISPAPNPVATDQSGDPVRPASIRGWLGNELGHGLSGISVHIRPTLRLAGLKDVYSVTSDARGEFQVDGLPTDMTYRLDVEASQFHAGYTLDPFSVIPGKPVTKIILKSIDLIDVDGMIVGTDNSPVANFEIFVQNLTVDFPGRWIRSDASGFFRLESFPAGKLQLYTAPPDIFKIEELVLRGNEYRNLRLAIDRGGYHLSGWVSDENGVPLKQASVTLNSEFRLDEYRSYSYRSTETDSNGGFSFTRLGDQDHRLVVKAAGFRPEVQNHRFQSYSDTLRIQLRR